MSDSNNVPRPIVTGGGSAGVVCPRCRGTKWKVDETRRAPGRLLRFRVCVGCKNRVRTREVIEADLGVAPEPRETSAA